MSASGKVCLWHGGADRVSPGRVRSAKAPPSPPPLRPSPAPAKPAPPASQPATQPSTTSFTDPNSILQVSYPSDWKVKKDPDYVLWIESGDRVFTIDVPDLPPHIPGMIPLNLVVSGFIDDVKKQHPDVRTVENAPAVVKNAKGRQIRMTWSKDKTMYSESALLVIHADHVFILRLLTPADDYAASKPVSDAIVASTHWLK